MDNLSQISLGFVEETAINSTPPPAAREDQPVNIGVRIKKLKKVESAEAAQNKDGESGAAVSKASHSGEHTEQSKEATPFVELSPVGRSEHFPEESTDGTADEFSPESFDKPAAASFDGTEDPGTADMSEPEHAQPRMKSGRGRKSIRQISEEAELIRIPEDEVLFLKQYYTMGEVAEMFRVNQSLLRFWEAEFDILQPKKNKKGDRYFRPADIKNLHLIYHLLRQRKYTIEGAKDFLRKGKKAEEKFEAIKKLEQIRDFLLEMKASIR